MREWTGALMGVLGMTILLSAALAVGATDGPTDGRFRYLDLPEPGLVGAARCFGDAGGIESLGSKTENGLVTAAGIPFKIDPASPKALVTSLARLDTVKVQVGASTQRLCLLASTRVIDHNEPGRYMWDAYSDDAHFHARIRYQDGVWEEVVPKVLPSGEYTVGDWQYEMDARLAALTLQENGCAKRLFVYCIEPGRPGKIDHVELVDMSDRFALAVFAVTADTRPAVSREPRRITTEPAPAIRYKRIAPRMERTADAVRGESSLLDLVLDGSGTLSLTGLRADRASAGLVRAAACPLFKVKVGDKVLSSADFKATGVSTSGDKAAQKAIITLEPIDETAPVQFELALTLASPGALRMQLTVLARRACEVQPTFPIVGGIVVGKDAKDNEYFYPNKGGVLLTRPAALQTQYGGWGAQVQFTDISDRTAGGGLTLRVEDKKNTYKVFDLRKMPGHDPLVYNRSKGDYVLPIEADADSTTMAIHYQPWKLAAGERLALPETVIEAHQGDWREAARRYLAWVKTYYHSDRPAWLGRTFMDRAIHPRHYIKDGRYSVEMKGYEDVIGMYAWWIGDGQRGDYEYKPEMGDPAALRRFVEQCQKRGVRMVSYVDGWAVDLTSKLGKAKADEWGIKNRDGSYGYMCQASADWHDYLLRTANRHVGDLNLDGFYLDCSGRVSADCYNPVHHHKTPGVYVAGAGEMFRTVQTGVRETTKRTVAIGSEEPGSEVSCQWLDFAYSYVFFYRLGEMPRELNVQGVNFFRFFFSDVKLYEIQGECNQEGCRLAFFTGTGIHGFFDEPFLQDFWCRLAEAHHRHADAFASRNAEPLVPTLREGLYCNSFYAKNERVYTLFNSNYRTLAGELIALPFVKGAGYSDVFSGAKLKVTRDGDRVVVSGEIGPRDVTAVVVR